MITSDTLAQIPFFASINDSERATIAGRSADVWVDAGEWLIYEGEATAFFLLLEGRIEIVKTAGGAEHILGALEPGDFIGELSLILGSAVLAGLRATKRSRILRLEASDFHELIVGSPNFHGQILAMMSSRLEALEQMVIDTPAVTVTVIGPRWDLACYDLRDFLARNHITYRWLDPGDSTPRDSSAASESLQFDRYPVVVFSDGTRAIAPTYRDLAERLGLRTAPSEASYDVAIVGAGPAGLAAAVYGASEGLRTILIECRATGGQAGTSSRIENYLGFPAGLSGDELSTRALRQARRFGAEIVVTRAVTKIEPSASSSQPHTVLLDDVDRIEARAVVIATGVAWRKLTTPGADRFLGRGVYYGAARTEAQGTRGKDLFLVGGGNSAGQAAILFANYARTVTLLVRGEALASSMSTYLIDELATKANVRIELDSEVISVAGNSHLESIDIKDRRSGEQRTRAADSLFAFIGADAETSWLPESLLRDAQGFVCTGRDIADAATAAWPLQRDPFLLESSLPGIFAAGDVRHGSIKRVASSVGEGSMAIALIHQYLNERSVQPVGR
jgi:thioredoxin reductase (NADPH)